MEVALYLVTFMGNKCSELIIRRVVFVMQLSRDRAVRPRSTLGFQRFPGQPQ